MRNSRTIRKLEVKPNNHLTLPQAQEFTYLMGDLRGYTISTLDQFETLTGTPIPCPSDAAVAYKIDESGFTLLCLFRLDLDFRLEFYTTGVHDEVTVKRYDTVVDFHRVVNILYDNHK